MATTTLTQKEYREGLMKQNKSAALALATMIGGNARLRSHAWSDEQLAQIPNEELAQLAYEQSDTLSKEFNSCGTFLAYWRGLQRKKR